MSKWYKRGPHGCTWYGSFTQVLPPETFEQLDHSKHTQVVMHLVSPHDWSLLPSAVFDVSSLVFAMCMHSVTHAQVFQRSPGVLLTIQLVPLPQDCQYLSVGAQVHLVWIELRTITCGHRHAPTSSVHHTYIHPPTKSYNVKIFHFMNTHPPIEYPKCHPVTVHIPTHPQTSMTSKYFILGTVTVHIPTHPQKAMMSKSFILGTATHPSVSPCHCTFCSMGGWVGVPKLKYFDIVTRVCFMGGWVHVQ